MNQFPLPSWALLDKAKTHHPQHHTLEAQFVTRGLHKLHFFYWADPPPVSFQCWCPIWLHWSSKFPFQGKRKSHSRKWNFQSHNHPLEWVTAHSSELIVWILHIFITAYSLMKTLIKSLKSNCSVQKGWNFQSGRKLPHFNPGSKY